MKAMQQVGYMALAVLILIALGIRRVLVLVTNVRLLETHVGRIAFGLIVSAAFAVLAFVVHVSYQLEVGPAFVVTSGVANAGNAAGLFVLYVVVAFLAPLYGVSILLMAYADTKKQTKWHREITRWAPLTIERVPPYDDMTLTGRHALR